MAYVFHLTKEVLRRQFAVYVVIARGPQDTKLYVGKTGDNREGCNPLISRCGNHFSYNRIHSQIRNKLLDHEMRDYTYVFEQFDNYCCDIAQRRIAINRINEIERWVNVRVAEIIEGLSQCELLNKYYGKGYIKKQERQLRATFRTSDVAKKVASLVAAVGKELSETGRGNNLSERFRRKG